MFSFTVQRLEAEQSTNVPNVIGAIDCIEATPNNAFSYIKQKHFISVNVQLMCDASSVLLNVAAQWPGLEA